MNTLERIRAVADSDVWDINQAQARMLFSAVDVAAVIVSKMTPIPHPGGVVDYGLQGVSNDDWRALVSALAPLLSTVLPAIGNE